ncbi:hypothetical protein DTO166G4_8411 [Paecilomyces variotii]|uniref:MIT domain-containing protein n=1 Tax=Byssochlamys spectabilis TaxID=264951 RepID=A0A443HPS2_BYSSP|nr:hypothetical protein C8Q69DRAFT_487861 [Paecilomyces variotii]KAJ9204014.1 hypothetical protein DTO032I3_2820 [Paecilomyces variotii]KAJ9209999.1 hypothetical protein DTO166G4_8411 [Paecilomyces variotii]KAJ9238054.1 hypothetical protein DTO169E5_4896 [Paecilomyces variotii]KAJ9250249.1 hypothetical protein DTO207G8_6174 [Paecilomyces variotii]KAJ9258269.1 hypothetical protein DTO195F2_5311 [Paecilomyces variotii]
MLSKALQKANTAVLLDNAANFEGAIEAYDDACQLLQLVMLRSNGSVEEKLKLQEIHNTYTARISELRRLGVEKRDEKALPETPLSGESFSRALFRPVNYDGTNSASIDTTMAMRDADYPVPAPEFHDATSSQVPQRQSLLPSAFDDDIQSSRSSPQRSRSRDHSRSDGYRHETRSELSLNGSSFSENGFSDSHSRAPTSQSQYSQNGDHGGHISNESTSWLDTIDESGASSPASTRSGMSSIYLRQRRSHRDSHGTEAEFDAALDAAVEAAYDEGLEPAADINDRFVEDSVISNARRNVELAKQRVREAEREAAAATAGRREKFQDDILPPHMDRFEVDFIDEEAEEEERLLEEMTKGYVMDDFRFDLQSKSALPRESNSSGFSGRTWGSSVASNPTTAGTSLSTLAEGVVLPSLGSKLSKSLPPPPPLPTSSSAPALPTTGPDVPSSPSFNSPSGTSVKARRRLSGQNMKQLKIDTNAIGPSGPQGPRTEPAPVPLITQALDVSRDEPKTSMPVNALNTETLPGRIRRGTSNSRSGSMDSLAGEGVTAAALAKVSTHESDEWVRSGAPSPSRSFSKLPSLPGKLRKNDSSTSLRGMRMRNMSVATPDIPTDSPGTPSSSTFPAFDYQKSIANGVPLTLPTPTGAHFTLNGLPTGGLYLFDSNIHSPTSPGSPNPAADNAPIPLEPCPESFLSRPFWLMRCLYQTIAHPRGGYLSTKLFIPRDVWRVKNVKIKAVEEKISNCDLLTAALLKLAQVDVYDADAILEEMQSLENVLDQVQATLAKKLGHEVGVQGSMSLFRSTSMDDTGPAADSTSSSKTASGSSRSYLSSWRKLRSKNSNINSATPVSNGKEGGKENLTMPSLPMTSTPSERRSKRDLTQLEFAGPNANYMGALARLFDAAQVLDQIAHQVEDPGLKHSSPTHVGLELSTRHAAEFFGFYVCRFALNDVSMMLDKFIKRGSEWVLI